MSKKLEKLVRKFMQEQNITCAETIYQTDRVIEQAYDFIADLCEEVGYPADDAND